MCRFVLEALLLIAFKISFSASTCSFPASFADSTWHDNTKGDLIFTSTLMSGWEFTSYESTVTTWSCLDSSDPNYLVFKSEDTVVYLGLAFHTYMCLKLTQITEFSYMYYLMQVQQQNAGYERLMFSVSSTLTTSDVCNYDVNVPLSEFHVLIKSGYEDSAKIECPSSLLLTADYAVTMSDETSYCLTSDDVMDGCSNKMEVTFNHTTCSTKVAFSDGGRLSCVALVSSDNIDFVVLYNEDTTLSSDARRFSCIAADGSQFSVAPNSCTASQEPGSFPTSGDGSLIANGHIVTIQSIYASCGEAIPRTPEETPVGIIVGLVVGAVVVIAVITVGIIFFIKHKGNKIKEKSPILTEGVNTVQLNSGKWVSGVGGAIAPTRTAIVSLPYDLVLQRSKTEPILPSSSNVLFIEEIETPRGTDKKPFKASVSENKFFAKNTSLPPMTSNDALPEVDSISKKIEDMEKGTLVSPVNVARLPKMNNANYRKPTISLLQAPDVQVLPPIKKSKTGKVTKKAKKTNGVIKEKKKKGAKKGAFLKRILELSDVERKNKL